MNAVVAADLHEFPVYNMERAEAIRTLQHSLYPKAHPDSVEMVLSYCRAAHLDPMLKPVHIVPMSVKTDRKDGEGKSIYEDVDTIMPGIGLYRIQAARTGEYAGIDKPVFGPIQTLKFQRREWKNRQEVWVDDEIQYPEWCEITVYRFVHGQRVAFTAIEYWLENYATTGRYSDAPNAMWTRRTRGQIAKCVEAQALRKGFPEVGSAPTAEEMEGRTLVETGERPALSVVATTVQQPTQPVLLTYDQAKFDENFPKWSKLVACGKKTTADIIATVQAAAPLTEEQIKRINGMKINPEGGK